MPDQLTFDALKAQVASGTVDTVLVCFVDMQGRLTGKRFHAANFVEHSHAETHCCNYLLATDLEMATPDGYKATSWQQGYGDYVMRPDLNTLRPVPWLEGTVMVPVSQTRWLAPIITPSPNTRSRKSHGPKATPPASCPSGTPTRSAARPMCISRSGRAGGSRTR